MKIESLQELFVDELQDLYDAENRILNALQKMTEHAHSPELKAAFREHYTETQQQLRRLDQIFDELGDEEREGKTCKGVQGIIEENESLIKEAKDPDVRDAGMIAGAQRVEHYEMAAYGTVRTYAGLLGRKKWADLLQETLDEEKNTDSRLTELAETINIEAKAA
ncbi:MAG: ferritin-like domain-containing protein [Candidatus Korobacteraceae bacterium]